MRSASRLWFQPFVLGLASLSLLLAVKPVAGQEVGTLADVQGTVEIERAGVRIPGVIGTSINAGDEIHTGRPGGALVVFQDVSTLVIGEASQIRVEEHGVAADRSVARSVLYLSKGRVRAIVSDYYGQPGTLYEIQTPVAQAGVRGTEFVITYDPVAEVSDIVGLSGAVQVYSTIDRALRGGVTVPPQSLTVVAKASMPTAPRPLPATRLRSYLDGLEFIGGGAAESLTSGNPVLAGQTVLSPEQAPTAGGREPGTLPYQPRSVTDATGETTDDRAYPTGVDVGF